MYAPQGLVGVDLATGALSTTGVSDQSLLDAQSKFRYLEMSSRKLFNLWEDSLPSRFLPLTIA